MGKHKPFSGVKLTGPRGMSLSLKSLKFFCISLVIRTGIDIHKETAFKRHLNDHNSIVAALLQQTQCPFLNITDYLVRINILKGHV